MNEANNSYMKGFGNMPEQLVQTSAEFERYTNIWLPSWIENGHELESYITPNIERYIFFDKSGDWGSIEIVPYDFTNAPINEAYPFNKFSFLKEMKIVKLEKLVIKKEIQSIKKLHEIFSFLTNYVINNNFDGCIALTSPQLYEAFVWRFKLPVKNLMIHEYSSPYVPILIDVEKLKTSAYYERVKKKSEVTTFIV